MQLPDDIRKEEFDATPYELEMSRITGKKPSFFRIPRNLPCELTREQKEMILKRVTPGLRCHKLFTKALSEPT